MERNIALEFVRVTEAAAIAAASWIGKGDKNSADSSAVDEMRDRFNQIDFTGRVVIGEGTKDEAPKLYIGEKIGKGGKLVMDVAVDPLECTSSVAFGRYNAISVIASGPKDCFLNIPDTEDYFYMDQIAVGSEASNAIDINLSVSNNIKKVAKASHKKIEEMTVILLDRPRHAELISEIRSTGARVKLITDGTIAAAIATCMPDSGVDMMVGVGGSPEAVISASAIKAFGGELLARFSDKEGKKFQKKIFSSNDLAKGKNLTFTATGIIDGPLLQGIRTINGVLVTHSIVIRSQSGTIRYITTHHHQKHD